MKNTCEKAFRTESGEIICGNTGKPCCRSYFDSLGNRWKIRAGSCPDVNAAPAAPKKKTAGRKKNNG